MEILELEQKFVELQSFLNEPSSKRTRLIRISEFFDLALSSSNLSLIEAYTSEFLPKYFTLIKFIKIRGLNPEILVTLQDQLSKLNNLYFVQNYAQEIEDSLTILKNKYELLSAWLNGNLTPPYSNLIYFPVLEKSDSNKVIGFLEIIKVSITDGENKFIVEPAESEEDAQLEKQLHLCWQGAVDYCKKYIKKIKPNHTVELKFENKLGIYIGSSFGIALTLAFIEAILKYYNSKMLVSINGCIAVTGGIDNNSKIISTSKTIIEAKVETVFYSDAQIFCVPKVDEMWAEEKLKELKKHFPKRKLRIIGLSDLDDLLDRRQIVEIRKQKLIVRSSKFVKKNWISAAATVLLAILFSYLFVIDFDDNPTSFSADGQLLYIKNKNGKILWSKNLIISDNFIDNPTYLNRSIKIVDIDNNGRKEIIIIENGTLLVCYDAFQKKIWEYEFEDSVISLREKLNTQYSLNMIDTITIDNKKYILLIASNGPSFSSAIFRVDLQTGQRGAGTLWAAGHFMDAIILDFDNNGIPDVIGTGYENGYEDLVFFGFELDTVISVRPTKEEYMIKSYPAAEMMVYLRFPKTDFDNIFEKRTPGYLVNSLIINDKYKRFAFAASFPEKPWEAELSYEVDYNFIDINIVIDSDFRVQRDSLVSRGLLNPPYTDTEEYKKIIKSNILYWKDGNWVKRNELE